MVGIKVGGRQVEALRLQILEELRPDPGSSKTTNDAAVLVQTFALESKNLLHLNYFAFHTSDFGKACQPSLTVAEPLKLDDHLDG